MEEAKTSLEFHPPERAPQKPGTFAPEAFKGKVRPDWCPSCGDYAVLSSLEKALSGLGIHPKDVLCVSGIGCSSNLPGFLRTFGFHGLHGRALPVATGAKLANPGLTVITTGGDGDAYGIGLGHLIHSMRRNLDITALVMNNQIYGLTTGQASPTTDLGTQTKSTPEGGIEMPIKPLALAIVSGATFVARAFSGDPGHMTEVLTRAIAHKGFSLVDCLSPCVTFNKLNTYAWFKERVYKLEEKGHDPTDPRLALERALEWHGKCPIGVFYEASGVPTYEDRDPAIKKFGPPVKRNLGLTPEEKEELLRSFL